MEYILVIKKTDEGNTPSDDLACIELSPGKAYVRGYEVDKTIFINYRY